MTVLRAIILAVWACGALSAAAQPLRIAVLETPRAVAPDGPVSPLDHYVAAQLFEGLTRIDAAGGVSPGMAASWTATPDGRQISFVLRDDLTWSDGSPITAQDIAAHLNALATQDHSSGADFSVLWHDPDGFLGPKTEIIGVELTDPRTLVLTLGRASHWLLYALAGPAAVPPPAPGLVNGPYRVIPTRQAGSLRLAANSAWHGASAVKTGQITLIEFPDPETAWDALRRGDIDIAPVPSVSLFEAPVDARLVPELGEGVTSVMINYAPPPHVSRALAGPAGLDARHALSMAIDREFLIEGTPGLAARPWLTPLPPGVLPVRSYQVPFEGLGYPERDGIADALLTVSGYSPDAPLNVTVIYPRSDRFDAAAAWLAREWQDIGVEMRGEALPWPDFHRRLEAGDFQAALLDTPQMSSDPARYLAPFRSTAGPANIARYTVPSFDEAFVLADQGLNPDARGQRFKDAEKELIEDQLPIALYSHRGGWVLSNAVQGFPAAPAGLPPLTTLWLEP